MEDGRTLYTLNSTPTTTVNHRIYDDEHIGILNIWCFCCTACGLADVRIFVENVFLIIILIHEATAHDFTIPLYSTLAFNSFCDGEEEEAKLRI